MHINICSHTFSLKHFIHAHTYTRVSRQAVTSNRGMCFLIPNSQGLKFLQRGVRCEDVKEGDDLRG